MSATVELLDFLRAYVLPHLNAEADAAHGAISSAARMSDRAKLSKREHDLVLLADGINDRIARVEAEG